MDPGTSQMMRRVIAAIALLACALPGRAQSVVSLDPAGDAKEQAELTQAVGEAGASPIDVIRALEAHLAKYPESKQRPVIEKALAKAGMETNDNARIILYGEKVLARETPPDNSDTMGMLDRVIRSLIDKSDPAQAKQAIAFANRYESDVAALRTKMEPPGHLTPGQWSEELNKASARALALKARATGNAGDPKAAEQLASESWDAYPTGEGAREAAFWLIKLDRNADAIEFYADAFTLEDSRTTEADRARDRARLGEIYSRLNGSEKGLGDAILQAYDRTSALLAARRASLKAMDPNAVATNVADFTLPPVDKTEPPLVLSSLKGKTVVMDFWATWCAPCRAQQPLIEKVKARFENSPNIVFVPVDSDDDTSLVAPFVKGQGWKNPGYLEGGLARQLTIGSIPTVLIIGPDQKISSRMVGFIPDRFEQMLMERIEEATNPK
jgi:thiol-disulfide isomerase/thioredoxin